MASSSPSRLIAPLVTLLLLLVLPILSTAKPKLSFTADLIHRDSPRSPYHNSSLSPQDRLREAARRSVELPRSLGSGLDDISSPLYPNRFNYLMSLPIGTPPVELLAIVDTGSDLTWVQCKPCDSCYKQKPPMFDPSESSTYKDMHCNTKACSYTGQSSSCSNKGICQYEVHYGDGSYSGGLLAADTLTFSSGNRRPVSIPHVVLGCTHMSEGTFDSNGGGLVGLGRGPVSLVSQLANTIDGKFSYCLVPYSETTKSSSITFGSAASGSGTLTTPIFGAPKQYEKMDMFYFLSLESITVSGWREIPLEGSEEGNIIIDSGTTLTLLPKETLEYVQSAVLNTTKLPRVSDPSGQFDLCFQVDGNLDDQGLPEIAFGFRGAKVTLPTPNMFLRLEEGLSCLALGDNSNFGGISIYGNLAQQNFHVGYDLLNNDLSFRQTDCTNLT